MEFENALKDQLSHIGKTIQFFEKFKLYEIIKALLTRKNANQILI